VSEFIVETFASCESGTVVAPQIDDLIRAAEQVSEEGMEVRLLVAILVPGDETCFYLFESSSADAVRDALARAQLGFERIGEAISARAPSVSALGPLRTGSCRNAGASA
jgi:hypothetical protein